MVNSAVYQPFPARFTLIGALSVSRMIAEYSLICVFHHVWKKVKFMVFTFLENALNLGIFTHVPVSHSKLQAEIFENLFPPTAK